MTHKSLPVRSMLKPDIFQSQKEGSSRKRPFSLEDDDDQGPGSETDPVYVDDIDEDFVQVVKHLQVKIETIDIEEDNLKDEKSDNDAPEFIREVNLHEPTSHITESLDKDNITFNGTPYTVGETWEKDNGEFLKIERFVQMPDTIYAQGKLFRRTRTFQGRLPRLRNEVCMVVMVDHNNKEIDSTAPLSSLLVERDLSVTNANFPCYSFRSGKSWWMKSKSEIEEQLLLACRYKYFEQLEASGKKIVKQGFARISERQADVGKSVPVLKIQQKWRTGYKLIKPSSHGMSFGEICAGAGGMTSGMKAIDEGSIHFLVDHWPDACTTLRMNFQNAKIMQMDVFAFIAMAKMYPGRFAVQILHVSLPCQYYARCHTVPGKNDEANTAANLCIRELLEYCRPRIVTFEQTAGIIDRDGGIWLNVMLHQITDCGYSVHWRVVNMANYGNCQARKRLIAIAAAPGEELPDFPEPTHGMEAGLKPFVTINKALSKLRRPIPENMDKDTPKNRPAYDGNRPLKHCITCNGGESDVHMNGKRSFNLAELALLQSFPPTHKFYGNKTSIRKQIGNAVPSCFAETLFRAVIDSLKRSDRRRQGYSAKEVIDIR